MKLIVAFEQNFFLASLDRTFYKSSNMPNTSSFTRLNIYSMFCLSFTRRSDRKHYETTFFPIHTMSKTKTKHRMDIELSKT